MQRAEGVCVKTVGKKKKWMCCFYVKCVSEMQMGPEWRSDVELQFLQRWLQPQRRQIWIKSHWEICRVSYANCVVMPAPQQLADGWRWSCFQRLTPLVFFSSSAYPTGVWVRGSVERREREGEISSPPSLSVAEYFVRTASQKPVSSLQ